MTNSYDARQEKLKNFSTANDPSYDPMAMMKGRAALPEEDAPRVGRKGVAAASEKQGTVKVLGYS